MNFATFVILCLTAFQFQYILTAPSLFSGGRYPCPSLKLLNGRVRLRSRGRVARFKCDPGYQMLGLKLSTCIRGTWDIPVPLCLKADCPVLPKPNNGFWLSTYSGSVATLTCDSGYNPVGILTIFCINRKWNDTIPACEISNPNPKTSCDFESEDLCGWLQGPTHHFDWRRHNYATPSGRVGTGPSFDHTLGEGFDGHYMYIESSSPRLENDTARLFSPVYKPELSDDACFVFWYHMYGATTGTLSIYLKLQNDSTSTMSNLFKISGEQGNKWYMEIISLSTLDQPFQIIIEALRGRSYVSDIAIDDVSIEKGDDCLLVFTTMESIFSVTSDEMVMSSQSMAVSDIVVQRPIKPFPTYLPPPPPPTLPPLPTIFTAMVSLGQPYPYSTNSYPQDINNLTSIVLFHNATEETLQKEVTHPKEVTTSPQSFFTSQLPELGTNNSMELFTMMNTNSSYQVPIKNTVSTVINSNNLIPNETTLSDTGSTTKLTTHSTFQLLEGITLKEQSISDEPIPTVVNVTEVSIPVQISPNDIPLDTSSTSEPLITSSSLIPIKRTKATVSFRLIYRIKTTGIPATANKVTKLPASGTAAIAVGSIIVLGIAVVVVIFIARRRRVKRNDMAEDSDVRYLTSDEVLDFNLARPADDDDL